MDLKKAYELSIEKWEHILEITHDDDKDVEDLDDWCGEPCGFCEQSRYLMEQGDEPCTVCKCPEGACFNSKEANIIDHIHADFVNYYLECDNCDTEEEYTEVLLELRDQLEIRVHAMIDLLKENYKRECNDENND